MNRLRSALYVLICGITLLWGGVPNDVLASSVDLINRVPVPPGTQLGLVNADSVQNGNAVSIATYESPLSLDETLLYYESIWPHAKNSTVPGRIESVVGDWLLISSLLDGANTVIQLNVNERFRSTGFVSVMATNTEATNRTDVQIHSGYRELSNTSSKDGLTSSTLSVLQSNQSMNSFVDALIRQRTEANWLVSSHKRYERSHIVLMHRQQQRIELVVNEDERGTVLAVVNEVRNAN